MTKIIDEKQLEIASESLRLGGVVCFPTETVYGIGVRCDSEPSFKALVNAKKRSPDKPFALMCSSFYMAGQYIDCDEKVIKLMNHFLPGEVTFLVKAKADLPHWITLGTGVIGIRVPSFPLVQRLINGVGVPCLVTSANISGEPTSSTFEDTKHSFDGIADVIVGGECISKLASTIVDVSENKTIKLIREGSLSLKTIEDYWRNL